MGYQAEIAFDEDIPGLQVALCRKAQIVLLLFLRQGLGEAPGGQL